jgi:hypothetical protein
MKIVDEYTLEGNPLSHHTRGPAGPSLKSLDSDERFRVIFAYVCGRRDSKGRHTLDTDMISFNNALHS